MTIRGPQTSALYAECASGIRSDCDDLSGVRTAGLGRLAEAKKLAYVDTLRGLAIVMVVMVHQSQKFPSLNPALLFVAAYGQMGVQLFFVASAFTLCRSAELRRSESRPVSNFLMRRFCRIAPLYYFAIILYPVLYFVGERNHLRLGDLSFYTPLNVLSNVAFVHCFLPSACNNIVPGGWSIAAEMTFYAAFPLLFYAAKSLHSRFGLHALIFAIIGSLFVDLLSQLAILRVTGRGIENNNFLYFNIINQIPVFLTGMLAYFVIFETGSAGQSARSAAMPNANILYNFVGFGLATSIAMVLFKSNTAVSMTLLPTVAAVSFIYLLFISRAFVKKSGILERIGQVSFSMYIFHFIFAWHVSSLLRSGISKFISVSDTIAFFPILLLTLAATFCLASFSKTMIEDRFIRYGQSRISAREAYVGRRAPGASAVLQASSSPHRSASPTSSAVSVDPLPEFGSEAI